MRFAIYPTLVTAMAACAIMGSAWPQNAGLAALTTIVLFYTVIGVLEYVCTHRTEWRRSCDDVRTDATHLVLTGPTMAAVYEVTLRGAVIVAGAALAGRVGLTSFWPSTWPMLAQLFLAITVAEFGHYVFHRLSHERDRLWSLHATHHSARRLYWLNATRFHPFDLFALIACQTTPLLLLGIDPRAFAAYAIFQSVYGQIQHCNVDAPTGRVVDWVFSTPGIHRWHHSIDPREGNHNYGAILNVWDHVFGTYYRPERPFAGPVGIADPPRFPTGYLAQLAVPFRWRRLRETT